MIIVESKAPRHYNLESLQVLEDNLKRLVASHSMLKKQFLQFPKLIQIVTEDAVTKVVLGSIIINVLSLTHSSFKRHKAHSLMHFKY